MTTNENDRRKKVIEAGRTDTVRWSDPGQLEVAWRARALFAADFIPAGTRVLDIGCGDMTLEQYLPFGCTYVPCDVVRRDDRTTLLDLNREAPPAALLEGVDLVSMLGVWEYLYQPRVVLEAFAAAKKSILCSYCVTEWTSHVDRRALGWVNDFSSHEFTGMARDCGYTVALQKRVDPLQSLFKLTIAGATDTPARKRVHVISYNNVGNFGDRLGFHVLNELLPPHAEVSWGTLRPFTPVPDGIDLLVVGIGNSLFGDLIDDALIDAAGKARASIGIFGTQYRAALPVARLHLLADRLSHWFARYEDDVHLYGRGRTNVSHLGDWLINAFPLARASDDRTITIGKEIWNNLPLDRVIQQIQAHKVVVSGRLHPLLCALTSADKVAYREQRESGSADAVSGKFRSMLFDVFAQTFPEGVLWEVDRDRVLQYKAQVRRRSDDLARRVAGLLG
jgi:hypothetical protein